MEQCEKRKNATFDLTFITYPFLSNYTLLLSLSISLSPYLAEL